MLIDALIINAHTHTELMRGANPFEWESTIQIQILASSCITSHIP